MKIMKIISYDTVYQTDMKLMSWNEDIWIGIVDTKLKTELEYKCIGIVSYCNAQMLVNKIGMSLVGIVMKG